MVQQHPVGRKSMVLIGDRARRECWSSCQTSPVHFSRLFNRPPVKTDDLYNAAVGEDRAKREAELVAKGASASEAVIKADKELAASEESQQEKLVASLATEK